MEMEIHWQVKFRSLRTNTLYTANIYDADYTGSAPVQLTGADNPFETQEDDTDDVFTPVRTQTGYLRIVDTGEDNEGNVFNWREFIPTTDIDRPVTLTDEDGVVMWMGFMQAQNFGARLYDTPQEREFPLQCPLTVASCTDVDITQNQLRNFAFLLKKVVDRIPSVCRPKQFFIQGGLTARDWLLKCIDWQHFVTEDNDGNLVPRFNMFQCLEEMCRFWGWTARICRTTLYLMCPDDEGTTPTFLELTYTDLLYMVAGVASGTVRSGFTPAGFESDIFASVDNADYQMRGPNKAVVTANGGSAEGNVLETYPLKVLNDMYNLGFVSAGSIAYDYTEDMTVISHHFLSGNCAANASFNVLRLNPLPSREESLIPVIRIKQDYNGNVLAELETNMWHAYDDGNLRLTGEIYKGGEKIEDPFNVYPYDSKKQMRMRLGIGATRNTAKWWDGASWVDNETTFIAMIGGNDDIIFTTDDSGNIFGSIPTSWTTTDILYGRIFVYFLGSQDETLTGGFDIASFKIQFERTPKFRDYKNPEREGEHAYTATATGEDITHNSYETDTIFTSYMYSVFGFGVVLNEDYSYYHPIFINGIIIGYSPEQHLADRIINYWQVSRRKIDCELRSYKIIELTPRVVGTIDGTRVYPLSVSHNWRDEVERVVFIELPEQ
jgi:hypothetical protein